MRLADLQRSLCAGLVSLTLALALPVTSFAAPAQGPAPEGPAAPASDAAATGDAGGEDLGPAAIRSALEAGDLTTARELAVARSEAEPTADSFALEAEVHLALGDYQRAKSALDRAIAALPEDATQDRAALLEQREAIEARSRGARSDEPESTHREQLDRERAERLAALAPKSEPIAEPIDQPKPSVPITKKWYFWVTLGAIVATAGAIVGVAVASSVEERKGDAASRQGMPAGGMTIRF
ncbi:MAG TPA: hypothetical protein VK034_22515 [Enhygromyxa sp.]|nr:hypothetical protein [Enhygromyxa sp.]